MFELKYPAKILFGRNSLEAVGKETSKLGKKALLVTGKDAMRRSGILQKAIDLVEASGIEVLVYDQVEHDPSTEMVDCGTQMARETERDVVIGLGGGSALDAAKAIACMVNQEGLIAEYQENREITRPGIPFIAIPTTAGTGAEATWNAVLTDRSRRIKKSVRSPWMLAKSVIVDPLLTVTMPPIVTASTGMDALTQAIEAYVCRVSNPVSDMLAIQAVRLISGNLPRAFVDGNDVEARENMALGSLVSGMAFANSSLGAVHGLAHPIGAHCNIPHGIICAVLLPYIMEYNLPVRAEKFTEIASAMGKGPSKSVPVKVLGFTAIEAVRELLKQIGLPDHLGDMGVKGSDIDKIVADTSGSSLNNNPRSTSPEELRKILVDAL